jgi:hypothetical protein
MGTKFKVLGLGLIAVMMTSAIAVMGASASTGGHFIAPTGTIVKGSELLATKHRLELTSHGLEGGIVCDEVKYSDYTTTKETETVIKISPEYKTCHTTGGAHNVTVTVNGCYFTFTVAAGGLAGTADLVCPTKPLEVTHPSCLITIPAQNNIGGLSYTTTVENNKHAVTLDVNAQFNTQYHGHICVFTGTNHTGTLHGSATVAGVNSLGQPVDITTT